MKEVFSRPAKSDEMLCGGPLFVPATRRLIVSYRTTSRLEKDWPWGRIELWDLADEPTLIKTVRGTIGFNPNVSTSDQIAFRELADGPATIDVIDLRQERRRFVFPPRDQRFDLPLEPIPAIISRNGKTVFGGPNRAVFDIEAEKVLWPKGRHESVFEFNPSGSVTLVEDWRSWCGLRLPTALTLNTVSVRDIDDGRLVRRTWERPKLRSDSFSSDGLYVFDSEEGRVYRSPPRVNWSLLAVCQIILALPFILLWAVLRWRRKRRLRTSSEMH